jgi:hypothetical protein
MTSTTSGSISRELLLLLYALAGAFRGITTVHNCHILTTAALLLEATSVPSA